MKTDKKIIKQIQRLCEKQYRKGFQQGYYACDENNISKKQVDDFRNKGSIQNYSKVIDPLTGRPEDSLTRLSAEMGMSDMEELYSFFNVTE